MFSLSDGDSLLESKAGLDSLSQTSSKLQMLAKLEDIKYTLAYEKGLMKLRCGFCKMYFHRSTVNYRVPNHRIIELEKKWNCKRDGKRYESASFLYNVTEVCLFCSQFFNEVPDPEKEKEREANREKSPAKDEEHKLEIKTKLERTDIAQNQRAYQSSEVDNKKPSFAVTEPYYNVSKTRREVDPWWEVDLGRPYHIHSISFQISTAIRQKLYASIFLLNKPYGFEDPFIDNIRTIALKEKNFTVPESDYIQMIDVDWELPDNTQCVAIRVQLKGINYLAIRKFQVFQGDDMIELTENDFELTTKSFASIGPLSIKQGRKEMMSPDKKKAQIAKDSLLASPIKSSTEKIDFRNFDLSGVGNLSTHIKTRYDTIEAWKQKVIKAAEIFPQDEIITMFRIIFKFVSDMNYSNKDHNTMNENSDLLGYALVQHYPRCDLQELHQRIRSIVRWIQTRSHMKVLGPLLNSSNFIAAANDPNEALYQLLSAFKRVEYWWNKKEQAESLRRPNTAATGALSPDLNGTGPSATTIAESRGCSWSQFLLIMNLFCTNQSYLIPQHVFSIDDGKVNPVINPNIALVLANASATGQNPDEISITNISYPSNDGKSVSSYSMTSRNGHHHHIHRQVIRDKAHWLTDLAKSKKHRNLLEPEQKTLLEVVREEHKPMFNSSFAEYRFAHMKKKISKYIEFPKELSLDFAETLNPRRAATSHNGQSVILGNIDELFDSKGLNMEGMSQAQASDISLGSDGSLAGHVPPPLTSQKSMRATSAAALLAAVQTPTTNSAGIATLGRPPSQLNVIRDSNVNVPPSPNTKPAAPSTPNMRKSASNLNVLVSNVANALNIPTTPTNNNSNKLSKTSSNINLRSSMASTTVPGLHNSSNNNLGALSTSHAITSGRPGSNVALSRAQSQITIKKPPTAPATPAGGAAAAGLMKKYGDYENNNTGITSDDDTDFADFMTDDGENAEGNKTGSQITEAVVDFHRVCALCELRFPRSAVEMKVFRKHVVKLRSSWDPKLVSKEIRSLDNTISMYNLVDVCLFCSQYFDPDFPDGIAYPNKEEKKPVTPGPLGVITASDKTKPFIPFYDTRYLPLDMDVGEVFNRPRTVESRSRAKRATEIAVAYEKKLASFSTTL